MQIVLENFDVDVKVYADAGEAPHHIGLDFKDQSRLVTVPIVLDRLNGFALAKRILEALRLEAPPDVAAGTRIDVPVQAVELPAGVAVPIEVPPA